MDNSDSVKFWWANWNQSLTTEQEIFVYHEKKSVLNPRLIWKKMYRGFIGFYPYSVILIQSLFSHRAYHPEKNNNFKWTFKNNFKR